MSNNYPLKRLCDVGVSLLDCEHKTPKPNVSGYPYIAIPDIQNGRLDLTNVRRISKEDYLKWTKKIKPQAGDIILTRRARVGDTAVVPEGLECAIGQNLVLLRSDGKQLSQKYLRWVLRSPQYWVQVEKYLNRGAVFDSLNCREIPLFEIPIPPMKIQQKIAAILSSLDDKIEINTRMNKVLEEIARALFHRWFVEFEFPNDEGKPYKSSGGRMIASEMGEIPEGWRVGNLRDLVTFSYGKPLKENDRLGGPYPVFGSNGIVGWHNEWLVEGPGIIVGRKGNPGIITWSPYNFYPIDTTFYVVPLSKDYGLHYLYSMLEKLQLSHLSADSAVPGLNREAAMSEQIIIPQKNVVKIFEMIADILYSLVKTQDEEKRDLRTIRDRLLQELLDGEIIA
ncbi:restriction endonuclease subunit S [Methanocorpusculum sp. MG]|uniref:Restriction endonuclease subunit S n=1 Tax=Methanocorpusculum petauri TaxID=3002863 RepID=A0ABT4IGZ5_9EURY|nr:restriction endonuclease subunit S [Methanocorpusculum petauri]MCZ0861017.1 restriction endonuclease subunit S [Methanocorpusculum petauri]